MCDTIVNKYQSCLQLKQFVFIVLDKTGRILKDIVIPDLIIEADSDGTLFDFTTKRDIQVKH